MVTKKRNNSVLERGFNRFPEVTRDKCRALHETRKTGARNITVKFIPGRAERTETARYLIQHGAKRLTENVHNLNDDRENSAANLGAHILKACVSHLHFMSESIRLLGKVTLCVLRLLEKQRLRNQLLLLSSESAARLGNAHL